jgi:hypothetical protein
MRLAEHFLSVSRINTACTHCAALFIAVAGTAFAPLCSATSCNAVEQWGGGG